MVVQVGGKCGTKAREARAGPAMTSQQHRWWRSGQGCSWASRGGDERVVNVWLHGLNDRYRLTST